jgi:hypothetical protein
VATTGSLRILSVEVSFDLPTTNAPEVVDGATVMISDRDWLGALDSCDAHARALELAATDVALGLERLADATFVVRIGLSAGPDMSGETSHWSVEYQITKRGKVTRVKAS